MCLYNALICSLPTQVLCPKLVISIVEGLIKLLEPVTSGGHPSPAAAVPLQCKMEAVNRLAQVVLVAIKTNCLVGSRGAVASEPCVEQQGLTSLLLCVVAEM